MRFFKRYGGPDWKDCGEKYHEYKLGIESVVPERIKPLFSSLHDEGIEQIVKCHDGRIEMLIDGFGYLIFINASNLTVPYPPIAKNIWYPNFHDTYKGTMIMIHELIYIHEKRFKLAFMCDADFRDGTFSEISLEFEDFRINRLPMKCSPNPLVLNAAHTKEVSKLMEKSRKGSRS